MTCLLPKGTILSYSLENNNIPIEDLKFYKLDNQDGAIFNQYPGKIVLEYELLKDLHVINIPNYKYARELSKFIKMMKATYPQEEIYTQYINRGLLETDDFKIKNKSRFSYLDETIYLNNSDLQFLSIPKKIMIEN